MKIREIILSTHNLTATTTFYTQSLQLPVISESSRHISLQAGSSILTFEQQETATAPVYHVAFNIPHNQLPEAIQWLQTFTTLIPVTGSSHIADFSNWDAQAVYFYDNNGNLLELIARHGLENESAKLYIDSISELGVVTTDPTGYADRLISTYGLPVFSRQPRLEQFTALGDDNGLLIIVAAGRNWFPTNVPAQYFPAVITIENNGNATTLSL